MSKLPENCPVCGAKIEKGYFFLTPSSMWGASDLWSTVKPERTLVGTPDPKDYVEIMWSKTLIPQREANDIMKGYRCTNCKLVLFFYEKEGRVRENRTKTKHGESLAQRSISKNVQLLDSNSP